MSSDLGAEFVGRAFLTHRPLLEAARTDFEVIQKTVQGDSEASDLPMSDWLALSATLLEFKPSLVVELGRGKGFSTALFQYWHIRRGWDGQLVSLCNTDWWQQKTLPALTKVMPLDWKQSAKFAQVDILQQDYRSLLANHERVLVLWDAHGHSIANVVLARIAPLLATRANLVVTHDMRDNRYFRPMFRDYEGRSFWRTQGEADSLWLHIGNVFSNFEQIIPLTDFCSRNRIPLHSATHSLALVEAPLSETDMVCYWHYLSVPRDAMYFPAHRNEAIRKVA